MLGDQREESPTPGGEDAVKYTLTLAEFLSSHFQVKIMWWIMGSHLYLERDILSGGLLQEGMGALEEEAALIASKKDELRVATIESVEIGWSLLTDLGAPVEVSSTGPNPIPENFDL